MFIREPEAPSGADQLLDELGLDADAIRRILDRPAEFDVRDDGWRGGEEV